MTDTEYREFWQRFLGRYPDFSPTVEQTKDWHRELRNKDSAMVEAAVATVITEKSSNIPRLPWFISAYYKIRNDRIRSEQRKGDTLSDKSNSRYEDILAERQVHIEQLRQTSLDDLRRGTATVLQQYSQLNTPRDANVAEWSAWLRACVWNELYGGNK
jgi:trans-2-enoyl-CoA reductase